MTNVAQLIANAQSNEDLMWKNENENVIFVEVFVHILQIKVL